MLKRVIFSGIQPTGVPHIGNYLGALANWQRLAKNAASQPVDSRDSLFFSVVGLHALTVPQDPVKLKKESSEMLAVLLALGLDKTAVVYHQHDVPQHPELAWYINCIAPVNRLMRMTSWKSKLATIRRAKEEDIDDTHLQLGLLAYPVLQTADILLYGTTHVPVGHDQIQHIELARDLALAFNHQYATKENPLFVPPDVLLTTHARIYSLRSPSDKMSKSDASEKSKIFITEGPESIARKIKSAVTDQISGVTWDPENRPGVSNLLRIYSGFTDEKVEDIAARYAQDTGIRDMKHDLVDVIDSSLRPFREEYERIAIESGYIEQKAREGADKAASVACETMRRVKRAVGL